MMRFSNKFSVDLMKENLDLKQAIKRYSNEWKKWNKKN
jgi:hypothetical protein